MGAASAHGSTRGVGERVAATLERAGVSAKCVPVGQVEGVQGFDAVIVGSAIHNRAWMPDATQVVRTYSADLADKQVWLFSVGMPAALGRHLRRWVLREGPHAVRDLRALTSARGDRLFSGVVRPSQFPLVSRVTLHLMGGRYGDFRNWDEIDHWAAGIASTLT